MRRRLHLFGLFAVVTLFVACTLNPQPLPPIFEPDDEQATPGGGFVTADAGSRNDDETSHDAGAIPADASMPVDGSDGDSGDPDAGDDAGDAGDAGSDAEID